MGKRFWSLVLSLALIGGVFSAMPAFAQVPPVTAPAEVQITDPKGDANFLNDQDNAYGTPLAGQGDVVGPADVGTATDILRVWFSNTSNDVSLNIELEGNPGNLAYDSYFRFNSNAGKGAVAADETRGCLQWIASVNGVGGAYQGETEGTLVDKCNVGGAAQTGPLVIAETPDKTFVITITFPRSYSPLLADGSKLTAPFGVSRIVYAAGPGYPTTAAVVTVDNTKRGTDYSIVGGGDPVVTDPGPPSEPKKPIVGKDCGKKKSRGKGAKKCPKPKPAASSCPAYVPGEEGAEAETSVVTAAATEEKPVEVTITAPMGIPEVEIGHVFQNIQVDAAAADAGLYVLYEFPVYEDHDIYLNYANGSEAAHAGGFNPAPVAVALGCCDGTGSGGHSEQGAEMLDGIRTADCAGYTLDMAAFASEGGEMTLKLWLGDVVNDPEPPAADASSVSADGDTAADIFFNTLGMRNPMTADSAKASGTPAATKGCKKGKGKKNGCKKPPVASCAPLTPAEQGADKPTVVVTDAATAEAPVEQTITLAQSMSEGIVDDASYDYFNVQVDSAAASAGLYVTFEFPTRRDYDLYARWSDGSEAASSHGFNPAAEASAPEPVPFDPSNTRTNHAGETHADSENLVGVITPDCGGYTIETANWLGEGGEFVVKLWLGEGTTEPLAPGEAPAA